MPESINDWQTQTDSIIYDYTSEYIHCKPSNHSSVPFKWLTLHFCNKTNTLYLISAKPVHKKATAWLLELLSLYEGIHSIY